jgi:BirA family biotin operon repressor/biotin-[acetyl-CoA-carboxylase] ligase
MSWPFVQKVIQRDVVASTSDLARQLLDRDELPLPLAVWAIHQTRGRGRGTNVWWSAEGSLTFTVALHPAAHGLRPEHEARLALATAVAVIDALTPLGLRVPLGIRWPNDIEAGDRKLGGILPERVATVAGPRLLLGIGLNVAPALDRAPPEIRRMAASLAELRSTAAPPDEGEQLLRAILAGLPAVLDALARDDQALAARWSALDTLRSRSVRVDLGDRVIEGVGRGIDAEGAMRVAVDEAIVTLLGGRVLRDRDPR